MANRPAPMGYSREIHNKIEGNYDPKLEAKLGQWLSDRSDLKYNGQGKEDFAKYLMDGQVLQQVCARYAVVGDKNKYAFMKYSCDLRETGLAARKKAKMNNNIGLFLEAYRKLNGDKRLTTFQTVNLVEQTDMAQVQNGIYGFIKIVVTLGLDECDFIPKEASANVRHFDEATLKAGQNVIGLQMGTNQVASQKGMTGYGQGRQIIHKTN